MTRKQYRTAMGKTVDMGALMLQNEGVRAVGNMHVNAKGDKLNSTNKIIDKKTQQIKRQNKKQTQSSSTPLTTSNAALKRTVEEETIINTTDTVEELVDDIQESLIVNDATALQGGLAAAIAKAKTVQQTKVTPPNQAAKAAGVRKI